MFDKQDVTVFLAAAGCAKTTELIKKFTEELKSYRSEDIALVTFTRKGVEEGRKRIMSAAKIEKEGLPYVKTLHSLCYTALGYKYENIFKPYHARKFNKLLGFKLSGNTNRDNNTTADKYLERFDKIRNKMIVVEDDKESFNLNEYNRFVNAYTQFKKQYNLIDFMDCLQNFVAAGKTIPVQIAMIDEAQDLTLLQWEVCYTAFRKCKRIYIAGDDYQSIYTYAGARPQMLIDLANKHKVVKLETSYRIPRAVYNLAKGITDSLGQKIDKDYAPFKSSEGKVELLSDRRYLLEMLKKTDGDWLVLFRNNFTIAEFARDMQIACIPYHDANGFVLGTVPLGRIKKYYNFRKKGFRSEAATKEFMEKYNIQDINNDFSESDLIEGVEKYLFQQYVDKYGVDELVRLAVAKPNILVSTIHKVKGGEAYNVAVFLDCTRRVFINRFTKFDDELRLLYVAFTRAKENLYLVSSAGEYGYDDIVSTIMESIQ